MKIDPKTHSCPDSNLGNGQVRCDSFWNIDDPDRNYLILIWSNGTSLQVNYCPFCGVSEKEMNEVKDE